MTKPTFYVDLDRTLFRTEKVADIFAEVARLYPDNEHVHKGYETRSNHYVYAQEGDDSSLYHHDFVQWLRDIGLDADSVFQRLAGSVLADGRFEYKDVDRLIGVLQKRGTVKILTYGEDRYQRFKALLCPSLRDVEVVTTLASKEQYLNKHAKDGDWIIDDKEISGLRPGIMSVRIVHSMHGSSSVASLADVITVVTNTH